MIDYVFHIDKSSRPNKLILDIPSSIQGHVWAFIDNLKSDYMRLKASPPARKRSTGKDSQNHHYYGHVGDISWQSGASKSQVHQIVKEYAVKNFGFPEVMKMGRMVPKSESECTVEESGLLIEACHMLAAEFGYELRESED